MGGWKGHGEPRTEAAAWICRTTAAQVEPDLRVTGQTIATRAGFLSQGDKPASLPVMKITRANGGATKRGPAEYFTGTVWLDEVASAPYSSDMRVLVVTFEPGARTAWHTHPHGQLLHILSGVGRVQRDGERVVEVTPGDVIWFEPGERHWHGATPNRAMVHLAVQRADEQGRAAAWQEHVSDAHYGGA